MTLPALPRISHYISTIDLVRQFHETFNHPVAKQLTASTAAIRRLRVLLIASELCELAQALGVPFEVSVKPAHSTSDPKRVMNGMVRSEWFAPEPICYSDENVDMTEAADALGDLDYVVQGGNLVFGIPAGLVMYEIHCSNMSKLDNDGKPIFNEDGKVVKGPNFKAPNIKAVLDSFDPSKEL